ERLSAVRSYQEKSLRLPAPHQVWPQTRAKGSWMNPRQFVLRAMAGLGIVLVAACGGDSNTGPPTPTPLPEDVTANAYILPGAVGLGATAFGGEPVVIHKGER